jgi:hypothetical protein
VTASITTGLRSVCFGDLDAGIWGVALDAGIALAVVGSPDGTEARFDTVTIDGSGSAEEWRLIADGLQLAIEPHGEPVVQGAGADLDFDQLCRVSGSALLHGAPRAVDLVGVRASRGDAAALQNLDSIRGVCAWFGSENGVALLALRPRGTAGHDGDQISAAVFEADRTLPVSAPRLSTTYTAHGEPARVSLELWLGEGEQQYPRRAAGETVGPSTELTRDGLRLQAGALQCHSRGLEGRGVYMLARPA